MHLPIFNSLDFWLADFPVLKPDGHKYDRGHALIAGGEVMTGAARLAAHAAQRMGAGLVTLAAPTKAYEIYAVALESIMVRDIPDIAAWQTLLDDPKKNAVLIGPGLGVGEFQREQTLAALHSQKSFVLDADALNNFSDNPQLLFSNLHANGALTPHEGEFARLFGTLIDPTLPKKKRARLAAERAGCVVVLKGAETIIASPDGQLITNTNAPPWLATAGSGDVLAGMIVGLLAQKMPVLQAAAAAVWLHGEIATHFGPGLIAEDIIAGVPEMLRKISVF